jgi:phosphoesterase RecJ-like protein
MNDYLQQLKEILATSKKTVIVTHPNPDGDAFGSTLAWKLFLEKMGTYACIVSPTNYTKNFKWLPAYDSILSFEDESQRAIAEKHIAAAEVIYCLDFNAITRLDKLSPAIQQAKASKVMIDHHQSPEDFAAITFSNTSYAATCELIYDIICGLGEEAKIDEAIAQNLYTGLTTDTGFFAFSNTTANVHKVAGGLLNKGVSPEYIQDKVFNIFREERLRYYGYCFLNKLHICHEGKVAYMSVNREEAKRFHLQPGDNESLVNFPFKVEGIMVSVLFTEEQEKVKISFRSKGKIDVNAFARKHFEGGGHVNAAGGKSLLSLTDTEAKFLQEVKTLFA